ncbi:Uncharacterized protein Fot_01480 [Forsythia ovata]|uniref:Methyltransferase n=1 Tax=Forsythia ovata TaxID=205694 RepID=A0ABD1X421_9LAMI
MELQRQAAGEKEIKGKGEYVPKNKKYDLLVFVVYVFCLAFVGFFVSRSFHNQALESDTAPYASRRPRALDQQYKRVNWELCIHQLPDEFYSGLPDVSLATAKQCPHEEGNWKLLVIRGYSCMFPVDKKK